MNKSLFNELVQVQDEIEEVEITLETLRDKQSKILEEVKSKKGTTFSRGTRHFQIRKRQGRNYICESNKEFNSWLKKEA